MNCPHSPAELGGPDRPPDARSLANFRSRHIREQFAPAVARWRQKTLHESRESDHCRGLADLTRQNCSGATGSLVVGQHDRVYHHFTQARLLRCCRRDVAFCCRQNAFQPGGCRWPLVHPRVARVLQGTKVFSESASPARSDGLDRRAHLRCLIQQYPAHPNARRIAVVNRWPLDSLGECGKGKRK